MALINTANKLATGRHQTGSGYGPDCQQVCKVFVLRLAVKANGNFAIGFKETNILPQSPASPICCLPVTLALAWTTRAPSHFHPMPTRT